MLPLFYEKKMNFFSTGPIFTTEVLNCCKIRGGAGTVNFSYPYLLIDSNKEAYLQLKTVLVYGSSPPKSHELKLLVKSLKITCK